MPLEAMKCQPIGVECDLLTPTKLKRTYFSGEDKRELEGAKPTNVTDNPPNMNDPQNTTPINSLYCLIALMD